MNLKKTAAAAILCAAAFGSAAQAQSVDVTKLNSNAVAETLARAVLTDAKQTPKQQPYVNAQGASLVCVGKIPLTKTFETFDAKGQPLIYPFESEISKFLNDPNAKDKATQAQLRDTVQKRNDLVYVQYTSVGGPAAPEINAYFQKFGGKPIDTYIGGTGARDGSSTTTILLDKATFGKFADANKSDLMKYNVQYNGGTAPNFWTACGPVKP